MVVNNEKHYLFLLFFIFNSYLCGRLLIDCSYFKCIDEHTPAILIGQIKKYSVAFLLLLLIMGSSSCGLFKSKNKCDDCPTWGQKELPADDKKVVNV